MQSAQYMRVHKSQRCQISIAIKFCMVASNICVWGLSFIAPFWNLEFWGGSCIFESLCTPINYITTSIKQIMCTCILPYMIQCHILSTDIMSIVPCNMHMTRNWTHGIYITHISNQNSCVWDFRMLLHYSFTALKEMSMTEILLHTVCFKLTISCFQDNNHKMPPLQSQVWFLRSTKQLFQLPLFFPPTVKALCQD